MAFRSPLSRQEILAATKERNWSTASFHLVINNMLSKGVLRITDQEIRYGRTYSSNMTRGEYVAQYADAIGLGETMAQRTLDVASALINRAGMDEATLAEIERMAAQRRENLGHRHSGGLSRQSLSNLHSKRCKVSGAFPHQHKSGRKSETDFRPKPYAPNYSSSNAPVYSW